MSDTVRQTWPPAAVDLLRVCFAAGRTASQTRTALAEVGFAFTRNAVIGKMHRLGLMSGRKVTVAPLCADRAVSPAPKRLRKASAPVAPKAVAAPPVPVPAAARPVVDAQLVCGFLAFRAAHPRRGTVPAGGYLLRLAPQDACSWPLSGAGATLRVCGCKRVDGAPYCAAHRKDAHQPAKPMNPYIPGDRTLARPPREEAPEADLFELMGEAE
ncbi:GcrA family cell cycle regulator [Azorhizobium sp. AG788]|uniref:GcrA family cell cycle regulator n=1 Tax=Azorhizobium sp. AG788 TaxID=2183897 RepID=UPI00313951E0